MYSHPPAYPVSVNPPSSSDLEEVGPSADRLPYLETDGSGTLFEETDRPGQRTSAHPFAIAKADMMRLMTMKGKQGHS